MNEMKQLLENVICELRGMTYEDALVCIEELEELKEQVTQDLKNIKENS